MKEKESSYIIYLNLFVITKVKDNLVSYNFNIKTFLTVNYKFL